MQRVIFTKFSNERSPEFAIRTDIYAEREKRFLRKVPCSPEAQEHVDNIYRWYQELKNIYEGSSLEINRCEKAAKGVELEYIEGQTLEEILDGFIQSRDFQRMTELLEQYINCIRGAAKENFYMTENFQRIFGEADFQKEYMCTPVTDIDMVLNNIIVCDGWRLVDYEWTFDFPIPVEFVIFRLLHYYFESTGARREWARENDIYLKFGVSESEYLIFDRMEQNFQQYIIRKHEPIRHIYPRITPGVLTIEKILEIDEKTQGKKVQLFWSEDMSIDEKNSIKFPLKDGEKMEYSMEFPVNAKRLRIDPGEDACMFVLHSLKVNGRELTPEQCQSNGTLLDDTSFLFVSGDPQIIFDSQEIIESFQMEATVLGLPENKPDVLKRLITGREKLEEKIQKQKELIRSREEELSQLNAAILQKDAEIQQKLDLISNMENTKIWKLYRKYRSFKERN